MRSYPTLRFITALCVFTGWLVWQCSAATSVDRFRPLSDLLPPPNAQRTASGAPGPAYWQQRVDYAIEVELIEPDRRLAGSARITYFNQSPDELTYLWLQLERNRLAPDALSDAAAVTSGDADELSARQLDAIVQRQRGTGGFENLQISDHAGRALPHAVFNTMLRLDLPTPLRPGGTFVFHVTWEAAVNHASEPDMRGGYQTFGDDRDGEHAVFCISLWYPRLAAYTDYDGWQTRPFLGTGEFTLEFGNFDVRLTVPDDHVVAATGMLKNPGDVLTRVQRERLKQAETAPAPVFVITPDEAATAEIGSPTGKKTWVFAAENVRDFAFASSRSFIWDAMAVPGQAFRQRPVLAMSFYAKEGRPLWDTFSTMAVAHAIDVFSRHTFPYPYPVAIAVLGGVRLGMEFPMINFNGARPEPDGSYDRYDKAAMISCVVHETGHNYFPMIVNSDERTWAWQDEALATFVEDIAMRQWEHDPRFARRRIDDVAPYLRTSDRVPAMTPSDSIADLGLVAYEHPTAGLQILREIVLGRERFDFAFRTYAQRWMFRRATPADFFRTMNDASGADLDWFWRAWFYSTDHVDLAIERIRAVRFEPTDTLARKLLYRQAQEARPVTTADERDATLRKRADDHPELLDEHSNRDDFALTSGEKERLKRLLAQPPPSERRKAEAEPPAFFTLVDFRNVGGIVLPLPLRLEFTDGTTEERTLPVEVWRTNGAAVTKLLVTDKPVAAITLDPREELTDSDVSNNRWPRSIEEIQIDGRSRFSAPLSLREIAALLENDEATSPPPAPAPESTGP